MRPLLLAGALLAAPPAHAVCPSANQPHFRDIELGRFLDDFVGLTLVADLGPVKYYERKSDKLEFAFLPVSYIRYVFIREVLTHIQIRTKRYQFRGQATKGYKTARQHLHILSELELRHRGCEVRPTKAFHQETCASCEKRYEVPFCNAPVEWAGPSTRVVAIFALEHANEDPDGPHDGFTVIEYSLLP